MPKKKQGHENPRIGKKGEGGNNGDGRKVIVNYRVELPNDKGLMTSLPPYIPCRFALLELLRPTVAEPRSWGDEFVKTRRSEFEREDRHFPLV